MEERFNVNSLNQKFEVYRTQDYYINNWKNEKGTRNALSKVCSEHKNCSLEYEFSDPFIPENKEAMDSNNPMEDMLDPMDDFKAFDVKYHQITE
jgi:hypothetical protein